MSNRLLRGARTASIAVAVCFAAAMPPAATAADTPAPEPVARAQPLDKARALIAAKQWPASLAELQRLDLRGSADWQNLMGYVSRKSSPPDLAAAETHYNEALRLEPAHRGALEYSGELYLMKGDLAQAEARLATLSQACNRCEEQADLAAAVARYKANGNRYQP